MVRQRKRWVEKLRRDRRMVERDGERWSETVTGQGLESRVDTGKRAAER